ncbi:Zn-dependent oligopeptidase [Nocardioides cavernae]|uniref:Zn-dependent oligopeptidase n=1 Tax=Nocardioides cavernae TaxID=1921566 RepID=A0ABR8N6W3_9ACTN|nr:M3 family metallopeptidase [Nocardioides cavernae]MBD3923620.1 Zn-dependent oligopeptidase [Nocardioides cavernae]MBM7511450.1 thimet oligopeptidase [Nocardioides cavernae]
MAAQTDTQPAPVDLPGDGDWLAWVSQRCRDQLEEAQQQVGLVKAGSSDAPVVLVAWNKAETAIANAEAVALWAEVHPDSAVRDLADDLSQQVQKYVTELGLDRDLYAVFDRLATSSDLSVLDADGRRVLEHTLRDFRRAGVDRDDATRDRLRALSERSVKLSQDFGRNIRDDVRSIRVAPERLAGLPEDYRAAHAPDEDGLVTITTDYPDLVPFITFGSDAEARHELALAQNNVAWPANDQVLQDLLAVRRETAELLGYDSWPDYDTEVKMIGNGQAVADFIDRVGEAAKERAGDEVGVLLERKRVDDPSADAVATYDSRYYSELVRREQYDVDGQVVRTYFPFEQVRQGLLDVTGRLFGLGWTPVAREDAGTWHDEVASYDVDLDGTRIGRIHLDLHPREGKFKHAAQFDMVKGIAGEQLPEGVLVCNFNRGLMEHDEVVTLFHEFGHLVHHVLAGQGQWARFSGVATEWDFVEAPSQMLEEWAWDADVLATFARNEAGETIPADLVAAMRRAEHFGKGLYAVQQMSYAARSYWFHAGPHDDLTSYGDELQRRYSVFPPLDGAHMHCAFGHLDGYSSGYYTYMWSLVIAKDLYSAFDADDLFAADVALAYRDKVLAMGGREDAADLVADFLGRPYSFDSWAAWLAE